jgi:hypothetical protein
MKKGKILGFRAGRRRPAASKAKDNILRITLRYQMTVDKSSKTVQKLRSSILKASDSGTLLKA